MKNNRSNILISFLILDASASYVSASHYIGEFDQILMDAVIARDSWSVAMAIKNRAEFDMQDENGKTPLMHAAELNLMEIVCLLHGPRPFKGRRPNVNLKDMFGKTALMYAAENGNGCVVRYLLRKGADWLTEDNDGKNAAHFAKAMGHYEIAALLSNLMVGINAELFESVPILIAAVQRHDLQRITFLLEHGAFVDIEDKYGKTALMYAAEEGDQEMFYFLVHWGADLLAITNIVEDRDKRTIDGCCNVLCFAAAGGNVNILQFLLQNGLDIDSEDVTGRTPLDFAFEKRHREAINFLLEKEKEKEMNEEKHF